MIQKTQVNSEQTSPQEPEANLPWNGFFKDNQIPETTSKAKPEQKTSSSTNEQKTNTTTKKRKQQENKNGKRSLRNFGQKQTHSNWWDTDLFLLALERLV